MTECAIVKSRWIVIGLLLISATAFAMSVWGGRWWSVADVTIGPFGSKHCFGDECKHAGLGWIGGTDRWMRTGMATWAAGVLTMLPLPDFTTERKYCPGGLRVKLAVTFFAFVMLT